MSSESGVRMTDKEIKTVFRKITTTKIVVLFFELILVYSLFLKEFITDPITKILFVSISY